MTITEVPTLPSVVTTLSLDPTTTANLVAAVKASAIGCSTDPVRDILTNVLVIIGDGQIKLVSTNSYMLFVVTIGGVEMPAGYQAEFMLKGKQFVTALPKAKIIELEMDTTLNVVALREAGAGFGTQLKMQEGTYPKWENLIMREDVTDQFKIGMNPKWLAEISKAANLFRGKVDSPLVLTLGKSEMKPMHFDMTIVDRGTFYALLMPVRLP